MLRVSDAPASWNAGAFFYISPRRPWELAKLIILLLIKHNFFDEAEAAFKQAIKLRPDFVEAQNNLANLLKAEKRYAEAEQAYKQILKYKPDFVDAHYNLGSLYKEQKKYKEAEKAYKRLQADYLKIHFKNLEKGVDDLAAEKKSQVKVRTPSLPAENAKNAVTPSKKQA